MPIVEDEAKQVRLICGSLYGASSPVQTLSEMFYAEVTLDKGAQLPLPMEYEERAVYVLEGSVEVSRDGGSSDAGRLIVFKPDEEITLLAAERPARVMLLGGEPLEGRRHIWWNFVSSSPERIEQAKEDWKMGRFAPCPTRRNLFRFQRLVPR